MAGRDLSEELFGPVGGRDLSEELFGPAPAPPPPPEGGFIPAVQRGFLQTGILLGDILPAMAARAVGADEYAERQFKEAAETEKKIQEKYAPAIASYKDVKGIGDAITYAVESVGELVPSILPSLFTGGLAGVLGRGAVIAAKEAAETAARKQIAEKGVQALTEKEVMDQIRKAGIDAASRTAMKYQALGAVGGSSLQNIPEVYKNIKDETEEESLGSAMLFGGLNSLLDAALPLSLLAKARKAGIPGEEIVGAWYKRFGVGAAKGFATEGATEAAQEMSSAAAEKFVDNNIDFFSEKNLERFINAGLKGGLGGGVVSGATDVMLGKKSLTEENKPLDQDIRDAQTDILARRALLDELRAQAAEEGRNKLDADSLKDLGFGTKYSLYDSLLNKDINDPAQAAEVVNILQTAVQDPATKGRERVVAANTLEVINQYLETRGEPDVGQVVEEPSGAGISVPTEPVAPAPAEGVAGVERTGVVPPVADVGAPVGGEGLAAAPVAPVETAPVVAPEVTAPEIAAPEVAAPAPEVAAQPAPEPVVPTTRELITEQETQLAKDMERFQNLLQQQVRRFGLNDVAVQIDTDLREADGQYTKGLIKLAVDAADPVRALRHESIHAMKELGFFTPSQWNALVNRANESWINTYLQNRNVDGGFIEPGQTSRYDAYLKLFKEQGLNEAQAQEALIEEAISDAFGDFSQTQAPPGMMRAILNRMKNFFKAIKETVSGSGVTDPERLFGKIEKGEVVAPVDKTVAKQYPAEQVAASAKEREGEPERREQASLRRVKQVPTAGRPEPTRDGGGRDQGRVLAPLDGAPVVSEATGPDPGIVSVAEAYAQRNGIPYKRQDAYVDVDEDRARRIAQAYEEMPHAPQDPAVKAAYADLIRQTRAQYDALVDAGYEFTFFDSNTDPYGGNPWNAMRDLRKNKRMAVYGTYDGFGTEGITAKAVDDNPMLADTGLRWKDQNGVEHMVTANDLFRAVHDAFGHGIEGAGFRARGEENAWQAHARLFTGPALGAITSETRGQNSWLNYGPYGEKNRTAKVEDTVFAEQKTGLMPEWTWQEGLTFEPKTADTKFSLRIMRGQEVPDIEGRITVDKIGKYFDDQIKDSFGRSLDYNNPKDFARALKIAKAEVDYQLKQEKSGLDWYEDDVRLAFEDTAKIIPQLNEPSNRILFSVIAGIMSPQTTARDNWFIAAKAYQHYVQTGDVPGINPENGKLWQGGTQSVNKRIQLEFLDRMIKDMGQAETINWLLADHTVKEINQFRNKYGNIKSGIDGKLNDVKRGIFAFGPKIGPFVSNINGIHDVTVDQWMIRTFNRYFGTMLGPNGEIINDPTEPQRRAVKDLVNKAAEDANIKPYQVQSLLWFYEQRLYDKIGLPTKSYGFSDGGRKFLEEAGGRGGQPSVRPAAAPTKEVIEGKASIRAPRSEEFRQFMAGSRAVDADGNPIVYYHGSLREKTTFRPKVAGAIFFSPDPSFAEGYIQYKIKELAERPGQYLSKEEVRDAVKQLRQYVYDNYGRQSKVAKDMLSDITEIEDIGKKTGEYNFRGELGDAWRGNEFQMGIIEQKMLTGRNITPVYISVKDPFDYEDRKQVDKVLRAMTRSEKTINKLIADKTLSPGMFPSEHERIIRDQYRDKILSGDWRTIELPEVQEAIRSLKHDGFYAAEEHTDSAAKNLAVYDSKQVVSATGNAGPFRQRPPTEEEAARVGLEPSEALKAQEEGDIRFSLRAHKDLFDRADEIPMSEGVEAIRDDWVGGVAGVGNRDSMYELFRIEGGPAYTGEVQKFLRNNLGENFKGYRLMSQGEFEELTTGSMGSQFVSFSLNPDVAKGFKNLPAYANRKDLVVVEMDLTPEHVHMVGHPGEQELVVDYGQGYNPAEIKVIEGDVERKSLRSKPFDPDSLPTNNKEYTLPQNTILYHGAYETVADAIQSVGYLTSRPKIKAHGGLTNEGGLVWFGSKETAQKYADSEADPGKVRFDREAGIIREPGKVFEAITDQPYKLISRYKVLSAKEANALNEALGLPDYKRLDAGESANTAAYRADVYSASKAERFEIKSGKYTETISSPWPIILKTLNADGFYSDGTVALTAENGIRLSEEGKPMERFSLRSQIDPAINARILQTTTAREEKSFPQRITQAIGPESWSRFRAAALNRYNRLGEYDKMRLKQMGGADLLADSNAESAALMSDLSAGIVAGSLGVYDKVGGVPVYNHHYVVERTVQTPTGPRTIVVGGKISNRNTAEALARRYPNSKVKERGYTAVSNLNNTIKGPIAIFAPLAKLGDPYAYQAYQYWAGVKRGSKWVTQTQGPQKGQVVEQLFNDPKDISKAEELRKKFLNDYKIDFDQIQKEWIDYNDQLVQYMLDTGVISRENAKKFKDHGDYIPFYRQINGDDDAVGPRVFQSIAAVKAPRKIKGGEDPLGDFLENVVRNTQAAVQAGLKNVAARRAADVGMDLGFVSRVTQAQADPVNSFYVMENGQKVFYDSSDPLLIDSIKSLGLSEFPGIGLLAGPAGVLRNLVTKDPGFMLANMMRDSLAAWTTSGVNMLPVAATLKNFTEALAGTSPEFKALLMSGVVGGYDYSQGTVDAAKQFGKELRKTAGARTIGEKAMAPFTSLWEGLEKGTQASDAATRIEVYKQTLRETGNEAEAMFRALEVMNFNRKGNNPIVRVATAAIPFLNARMQGLDVLYRAGLGKNATSNAKEIQKAFWRRGMYMAALSTMYWALTHDDDEYKKQEQETKDNNWLFPSAGVRVPIPFEVGVLFKVIPERIAALVFGDDSAKDFTASMVRNLTSTLAVNPIPQTLLPLVEATANFSFFTFRPIVGQGLEGVAAPYQIGPSTSRAGQLLAEMTKGMPSALQISPMKADAIIQGYTGTIGSYMSQLFDAVYDMHTDNPKASLRFEQLPVVKRFILDPDARGQVTAYFDLKNSVDEATRTANLLERSMNYKEWGEYYTQNIGLFAVKDYILDMDKTLKEYRDMKNMVRSMPMDADQKRDSILAITRIENQLNANIQILKKQAGK